MSLERPKPFVRNTEKKEVVQEPTAEERAFTERRWYHGSPKAGVKQLRSGGRMWGMFGSGDGIHIALTKELSGLYGENIGEWKLRGPLKIVQLEDFPIDESALRKVGYVGYYWTDLGIGSGVVWNGRDLEKIDETKRQVPQKT
mgnify:CR=1 FL=1